MLVSHTLPFQNWILKMTKGLAETDAIIIVLTSTTSSRTGGAMMVVRLIATVCNGDGKK